MFALGERLVAVLPGDTKTSGDAGKEVVEVVSDSSGEAAYGFHFLCLDE